MPLPDDSAGQAIFVPMLLRPIVTRFTNRSAPCSTDVLLLCASNEVKGERRSHPPLADTS